MTKFSRASSITWPLTTTAAASLTVANIQAMNAAQAATLTSSTLNAMSAAAFSAMSAVQVKSIAAAALAGLSKAQAGNLTATELAALTAPEIAAFTTAEIAAFSNAEIAALNAAGLTSAEISALSTSQTKALTTTQLNALAAGALAAVKTASLTTAQAGGLSATTIGKLTAAQVGALVNADVAALTRTEAASLTAADIGAMNSSQIGALSTAALAGLSSQIVGGLSTTQIGGLTTSQVAALTATQAKSLSSTLLSAFSGAQLGAMSTSAFAALSSAQLSALLAGHGASATTAQLAALTSATVASLSTAALSALTSAQADALSSADLNALDAAHMQALRLNGLSATSLKGLSAAAIGNMSSAEFANAVGGNVASLTTAAVKAITAADVQALSIAQVDAFTTAQQSALSASAAAALTAAKAAGNGEAATVLADFQSQVGNGSVGYNGLLKVLQDAATGGMNAGELSALDQIAGELNAASGVTTSASAQQLFDDVVLGNSANSTWTGGAAQSVALGNLSATSTQTQVDQLVGKWFLGTDLPSFQAEGGADAGAYQSYSLPLFSASGPQYTDINQGDDGDCYFLAGLMTEAQQDPSLIENMIHNNGNNTYTVDFHVNGKDDFVTVNNQMPNIHGNGGYPDGTNMLFASSPNSIWVSLVEKAYAQLMSQTGATTYAGVGNIDSYSAIDGGDSNGLAAVTGQAVTELNIGTTTANATVQSDLNQIQTAFNTHEGVMLGTNNTQIDNDFISGHMFAVTGVNAAAGTVTLSNPWGPSFASAGFDTTFTVNIAQLKQETCTLEFTTGASPSA